MRKLALILSVLLVIAIPLVSYADNDDSAAHELPFTILPEDFGGDIFFLDLVQLRSDWIGSVQTNKAYVRNHFDEILVMAIVRWRNDLRKQGTDVVSITPISMDRGQGCATSGLIFMIKRNIPVDTKS